MVVSMEHERWKKKLLESRKDGEVYQLLGWGDNGANDIYFVYRDNQWQFKPDLSKESVKYSDVNEATQYILSLGVDRYAREFEI